MNTPERIKRTLDVLYGVGDEDGPKSSETLQRQAAELNGIIEHATELREEMLRVVWA